MAGEERSPRIWIDVEHGAEFGSPVAGLDLLSRLSGVFGHFAEAWLFGPDSAPLLRGFYYPASAPLRFGIPRNRGPTFVLIDDAADQLWLSGLSCGDGKCATAAVAVLGELGFVIPDSPIRRRAPLADYAEMHFLNQRLIASRPLGQPVPVTPPGRTFVSGRRLVCRMEFDKGRTTPDDLRSLWRLATEPHGWLGRPVALTLYDRTSESQSSGYAGCQLIAVGESGRELWLQLPEPDNFDRVAPDRIAPYAGAFTEYQAVKEQIFRAVGVDIDPPHNRSWRQRVLGQHPMPPAVLHWP